MNSILPLLPQLVSDSESIIRQHLASQLLPLCLTCMFGDDKNFDPNDRSNIKTRIYNEQGYTIASLKLVHYMTTLITDADMDVRKAASDALATLALYIKSDDIPAIILKIPLQLFQFESPGVKKQGDVLNDLCITASHLLADIASIDPIQVPPLMVSQHITPKIIALCKHSSFKVRRAAVQALPRVVSGSTIDDVHENLIPSFIKLGNDEVYRVRKSVGECLVDMSRSFMILSSSRQEIVGTAENVEDVSRSREELKFALQDLRRNSLVPICTRLLQDGNKVVRHSMMQFLGPFMASFYPLEGEGHAEEDDGIVNALSGKETDTAVGGMGVQFFPHANGMVSRLSPETISSPTFIPGISQSPVVEEKEADSIEYLKSLLPKFLEKCDNDAKSLVKILRHRDKYPTAQKDIAIVKEVLLSPYVELATMNTGDDNIDAEMRVYCAYSLPAVVLLLGKESWDQSLKRCFLKLITGSADGQQDANAVFVPLPVKRCLASSFHTICNMLGPTALKASSEEKVNKHDLLTIFEIHFLRDADDTVRLNVIRNLPSFLSLLSFSKRSKYLPVLYEIIRGDTMLASKRKNALNPILLNWRQRDMIAQIMPSLICLYRPDQVRQYLWPIVKILLSDAVNLVRQNIEWSIPIILKSYEFNNCLNGGDDSARASQFSGEACDEIFTFLKATLLENMIPSNKATASGAFSKRQSFCRILSSIALILRLNETEDSDESKPADKQREYLPHPFYNLGEHGYPHLHHLLKTMFLPRALAMKEDRVTNVRLTLAKSLRVMPTDIRDRADVSAILRTLEDEIETWHGGGGQNMDVQIPKIKITNGTTGVKKNKSLLTSQAVSSVPGEAAQKAVVGIETRASYEDDSTSLASI